MNERVMHGEYDTMSPQAMSQYMRLRGISENPQATPEERAELANLDLLTLKMPNKSIDAIRVMQDKTRKGFEQDPNTKAAMDFLSPYLPPEMKGSNNRGTYNTYLGTLHDTLKDEIESTGAMPNRERVKQIGMDLLQRQVEEPMFGGWLKHNVPLYKAAVPDEIKNQMVQEYKKQNFGAEPTDEQIHSDYVAKLYRASIAKGNSGLIKPDMLDLIRKQN
jgi:hypothetical protein